MERDFMLVRLLDGEAPDEMNTRLVGPLPSPDDGRADAVAPEHVTYLRAIPFETYYQEQQALLEELEGEAPCP